MGFLQKNSKLLIGGAAIIAIGYVAMTMLGGGDGGSLLTTADIPGMGGGDEAQVVGVAVEVERQLIDELLNLKNITLNRAALDDPAFQTLEDFSKPIEPEPVGRPNPFALFPEEEAARTAAAAATEGTRR